MSALEDIVAKAARTPFFSLVRLIERALPDMQPIGGTGPFDAEPIRFKHDPSLVFHSTDVTGARLVQRKSGGPYVELTTTFSGLTGASSPLPLYFDEDLSDEDNKVQRDFLDVFHHRLLSLFYRGISKFTLHGSPLDTARFSERVLVLSGLPPARAEAISGLERATLLRLSPLLVSYPPNEERLAAAIRDVLRDMLEGAVVSVIPMVGGSVALEQSERPRLGRDLLLGRNSALGARVRTPGSLARVSIGPLSAEATQRLGPGGNRHAELLAVIALFTPETVDIEVELCVTHAVPARLGHAHLRHSAWLGQRGQPAPLRFRPPPSSRAATLCSRAQERASTPPSEVLHAC